MELELVQNNTMQTILYNLALIDTLTFCKQNKIDCSGTYLMKYARGYKYALIKNDTKKIILDVLFHKSSVPTHIIY